MKRLNYIRQRLPYHIFKMRLPLPQENLTSQEINDGLSELEKMYVNYTNRYIVKTNIKVMLSDGSVTDSNTFDPQQVIRYFNMILNNLKKWHSTGLKSSNTDDLSRIYFEISIDLQKYYMKGYFGIQFHTLKYYKVDKQVVQLQKELHDLLQNYSKSMISLSTLADDKIYRELKNLGLDNIPFHELFEKILSDQELTNNLEKKIKSTEESFPEIIQIEEKETNLNNELSKLIIETYQISSNFIDYNKLMQGEEGLIMYFDIDTIKSQKNKKMESFIDTNQMKKEDLQNIKESFREIIFVMDVISRQGSHKVEQKS